MSCEGLQSAEKPKLLAYRISDRCISWLDLTYTGLDFVESMGEGGTFKRRIEHCETTIAHHQCWPLNKLACFCYAAMSLRLLRDSYPLLGDMMSRLSDHMGSFQLNSTCTYTCKLDRREESGERDAPCILDKEKGAISLAFLHMNVALSCQLRASTMHSKLSQVLAT